MRGAKPMRALEEAVQREEIFARGQGVLVACSGGPDSVALAGIVAAVAPSLELNVRLAHINHGLRHSAWQDEAVVLRVAASLELGVDVVGLADVARDEASLREVRYDALLALARKHGAAVVATGHTAEDQTETVLLALFRGAGPTGIAGMRSARPLAPDVQLVRPLLRFSHESLCDYCHQCALPYALDPTNANLEYRRNAVRTALAALRPLFPGLDEAAARAAALVASELEDPQKAGLRRRVREALNENEALADVDFEHVEAAVRALEGRRSGRFFMNREIELHIAGGAITVHRRS